MQIQASTPGIQRELPQASHNRSLSSEKAREAAYGTVLRPVSAPQAGGESFQAALAPFVPAGLKSDSFEASDEAKRRLSSDTLRSDVAQKVAEQFNRLGAAEEPIASFDFSPEATASRIARVATGLFQIWRQRHPEGDSASGLDQFEASVRTGVRRGAREALDALKASGADPQTLERFRESFSELIDKLGTVFAELRSAEEPPEGDAAHVSESATTPGIVPHRASFSLLESREV